MGRKTINTVDVFWSRVDKSGDCWEWTSTKNYYGYGFFRYNGKIQTTHRLAYRFCVGPIPKGKCVLHSCDNPACVNPDHLFIGTRAQNNRDAMRKGRKGPGDASSNRLNERKAREVIRLYFYDHKLQREIADQFGIGINSVSRIVTGARYPELRRPRREQAREMRQKPNGGK